MPKLLIIDTGPLISAADTLDPDYSRVLPYLSDRSVHAVIPAMCVAEAAYMIAGKAGPLVEARFLAGLIRFEVVAPEMGDWPRIAELVRQYADFPLGGTDASLVALAERMDADTILTLDVRHFSAVKPRHRESFRLLPT